LVTLKEARREEREETLDGLVQQAAVTAGGGAAVAASNEAFFAAAASSDAETDSGESLSRGNRRQRQGAVALEVARLKTDKNPTFVH
jgi:transketolase